MYRVHVENAPGLGLNWGVAVGEIGHNLRSALDNLTWQLALLNTGTPWSRTQFPIFDVAISAVPQEKGGTKRVGFEISGRKMIRSLRPDHQAIIEQLQPYQPGRGGVSDPLSRLSRINDADKHRVVLGVGGKVGAGPVYFTWGDANPEESGDVISQPLPILEDGAEVLRAAPHVRVHPNILPFVVFGKGCPEVEGHGVCFILSRIAKDVSEIIERFAPEFS